MRGADGVGLLAHAAGHDHATDLRDRLADGLEALLLGTVKEAAGVDQHHVGSGIIRAHCLAVGPQAREDTLGIDERFGAAERDHPDLLLVGNRGCSGGHDGAARYTGTGDCATAIPCASC